MGMLTAMYSGVNGLNVHGRALSSVADNVANVSTHAYKATRTNFGDIMVHSLTVGGTVVAQVGTGARVTSVQNMMTQGSFESTDIPTDLAINGGGFFKVVDASSTTSSRETEYYTRAGQFTMDREGYLVTPAGHRLRGYNVDGEYNIEQLEEDIQILTQQTTAVATTGAQFSINLDAEDIDEFHPSQPIDPTNSSTYNYLTSIRVYDSLGISHDLAVLFQRMESYGGSTDPGGDTSSVWKAEIFENNSGTLSATPPVPSNTFYLQFDTDGLMVGTSTGDSAYGDMFTSSATLSADTSEISGRLGEVFSFTPGGGIAQSVVTSTDIAIAATYDEDEIIAIGPDSYDLAAIVAPGDSSTVAAQKLVNAINDGSSGYWATVTGSTVTVHSNGTNPLSVQATNDSDNDITLSYDSLNDVRTAINSGAKSSSALYLDLSAGWANGDTVTIEGNTFTYNAPPGGGQFNTLAGLEALIEGVGTWDVTVVDPGGSTTTGSLFIEATNTGTTANADTISVVSVGGTFNICEADLKGGVDGTATTNVQAPLTQVGSSYSLRVDMTTTGASETIALGTSNTLGESIGYSFDAGSTYWTQNQYAANSVGGTFRDVNDYGYETIQFDFPDATPGQDVNFYFAPSETSSSTQSAGASETFYAAQDGSPRGYLTGLDFATDGIITGQFSNGTLRTMGAVLLADFAAVTQLERMGENLWAESINSGEPVVNLPDSGGLGTIEAGALEQSNVDLATEFVKMINYQRAFQANSKTISTTDQMLAELINLKR